MTLVEWSAIAQIVASIGVLVSLAYVAVQLRQTTLQMRRNEANTAMAQASPLRQLILSSRDLAELLTKGFADGALDAADELRLATFFSEATYMASQVWDRVRSGFADKDELERITPVLATVLCTPRGIAWWRGAKIRYRSGFIADLERLMPALAEPVADPAKSGEIAPASPTNAPGSETSAIAPAGDAR